jgi:hypothetical protein
VARRTLKADPNVAEQQRRQGNADMNGRAIFRSLQYHCFAKATTLPFMASEVTKYVHWATD